MSNRMIIDDSQHETGPKTSIKITRAMGEDVGFIALVDILEGIEKETIKLSYSRWIWFISKYWNDPIWIKTLSGVITDAKNDKEDLNTNGYFLDFIFEKTAIELNNKVERKSHPIFDQAMMELVVKNRPVPEEPKQVKDLWNE